MFYLVYKITNNLNNKFYIGCHKTNFIDDGYMGSGTSIKRAIAKYGINNFTKEILVECSSSEEMYKKEKELVELSPNSYNMKKGGDGGFDYINRVMTKEHRSRVAKLGNDAFKKRFDTDLEFKNLYIENMREIALNLHKNNVLKTWKDTYSWLGKKHKEESKKKIGEKNSFAQLGNRNSQYGTMWITDGSSNKKIKITDIIPENWIKGRILKKHK